MRLTTKADSPSSNIIEACRDAFSYNIVILKILTEANNPKIHLKMALLNFVFHSLGVLKGEKPDLLTGGALKVPDQQGREQLTTAPCWLQQETTALEWKEV